jgi:hypothetical protein
MDKPKVEEPRPESRFKIERLEERIAPSVAGITNALTNNGADHRSVVANDTLIANLAKQKH